MTLSHRPFEEVGIEDIEAAVRNRVSESTTLEYKRSIDLAVAQARTEFCKDISALANADGGDVVVGVDADAETRLPRAIVGIEVGSLGSEDDLRQRADNVLRQYCLPVCPTVRLRLIAVGADREIVLIRVWPSWARPIAVLPRGESRCQFYIRGLAGAQPMTYEEIRTMFDEQLGIQDKARAFADERARTVADLVDASQQSRGKLTFITHFVSPHAVAGRRVYDLRTVRDQALLQPPYVDQQYSARFNFDGLVVGRVGSQWATLFRNGAAESACVFTGWDQRLWGNMVERVIMRQAAGYLRCCQQLRSPGPVFVFARLLSTSRCIVLRESAGFPMDGHVGEIDRSSLVLPSAVIGYGAQQDASSLKVACDALWQASGYDESPSFAHEWTGVEWPE